MKPKSQTGFALCSEPFASALCSEPFALYSSTIENGTAQHSTVQYSTALHSTAQQSTAEHSRAAVCICFCFLILSLGMESSRAELSRAMHSTASSRARGNLDACLLFFRTMLPVRGCKIAATMKPFASWRYAATCSQLSLCVYE